MEDYYNDGFNTGYGRGYLNDHHVKRQCPLCERDEQIAALESILRMIINDLPTNRDWLDPELEKAARDILKGEGDGAEDTNH